MDTKAATIPSISQVKPIDTSDASELDTNVLGKEDIQNKLVLRPWRVRFWDQFTALSYKQFLVYTRNGRATILRLLAPLFFMFLLWLLNIAVQSDNQAYSALANTPNPGVESMSSIPSCSSDVFLRSPCWDFVYSPNTSTAVQSIAEGMRLNNPGREISSDAVRGFGSMQEAQDFLAANPERVLGGVHFLLDANSVGAEGPGLNYILQTNTTTRYFKARFQDPTMFSAFPIQVAADREIARYQIEQAGTTGMGPSNLAQWDVSISQFAHPTVGSVNIVGQAMGPFVFAANMFNFVLLLSSVVAERERGLRQALKTSGMLESSFWLSWAAVELVISVFFTLFTIAFGAMFQFEFFLKNSFAVIFLLFLLFQWAMIGIAFLLSTMISKTSTAINLGFVIFIFGWVIQTAIAFDYPYSPENIGSVKIITVIFTLLPFAPLAKGSVDLGAAAESTTGYGISWGRRSQYCQNIKNPEQADQLYATAPDSYWNFDCVFPIGTILLVLTIEFFLYFAIAIYLNNVLADENGVRKKPWYFLTLDYWRGGGNKKGGPVAIKRSIPCPAIDGAAGEGAGDADVAAEEVYMKELMKKRTLPTANGTADPAAPPYSSTMMVTSHAHAVEVYGLQKAFGRSCCRACLNPFAACCCRKKSSSSEFWAIKGSWLSIEKDQLFCLLGPNGAGKTTTINCLTGVLPPTGGDALVYGESITNSGSMERIRSVMGVCPQFDVQWPELTGSEHLYIYGRVKGLPAREVSAQSADLLDQVKLTSAANQKTSAYSGGMRRRLSVAMALLGDPMIVYLDEPTTGMDPISRRHVWDCIEAAKPGRAIVLTTHSMEEADILGDTIAIMARGNVRAYGSSLRLKQRFGSGYQLAVAVAGGGKKGATEERVAAITELFDRELGVPAPEDSAGAYLIFLVPKTAENQLPCFLSRLEATKQELGITDIQISLTSLEEVFLSIAKRAEVEAAAAEGRNTTEVRLEDGSILEVEIGAEEAVQESTGKVYAVKWAQDEEGRLSVLSWSLNKENGTANGTAASEK